MKVLVLGGEGALRFDPAAAAFAQVRPDAVVNFVGIIKQLREASDPILTITLNRCCRTAWRRSTLRTALAWPT